MTAKKGDTDGVVAAKPMVIRVDRNSMTIGEIAAAEALAGVPIDYSTDPDKPKGLIMQAIACIVQKRTNPDFTFDDAADVIVHVADTPIPPTNGRAPSTRSRSARTSRS